MTGTRTAVTAVSVLLGALLPLLLLDGTDRAWGFRAYAIAVGLFASNLLLRGIDRASTAFPPQTADDDAPIVGHSPPASPFARPRRLPPIVARPLRVAARAIVPARRRRARLQGMATTVHAATSTAGAVHHRLRPMLCAIADERLRGRHGTSIDDPSGRAAAVLAPTTWELLRPDRPGPVDRLAAGLSLDDLEAIITDLERT